MFNFSKVLGFFFLPLADLCECICMCVCTRVCCVCGSLPNTCVHVLVFRVSARVLRVSQLRVCVCVHCVLCALAFMCVWWGVRHGEFMCCVCAPALLGCVFVRVYMFLCVCVYVKIRS